MFADKALGQLDLGFKLSPSVGSSQLPLGFWSVDSGWPAFGVDGSQRLEAVLRRRPVSFDPADRPLEPAHVIHRDHRLRPDDL